MKLERILKSKTKALIITDLPSFSWKKRIATFVSIFGILWLFLEPLSMFGGLGILASLDGWGYGGLAVLSILLSILYEYTNKFRLRYKTKFLSFTVILTESGTRYQVMVPQDMRIGRFLEKYLEKVSNNVGKDSLLSSRRLYEFSLLVEHTGKYKEVPSDYTFAEVGIQNGATCVLRGDILPEFVRVRLTFGVPPQSHDEPGQEPTEYE